MKKKKPQYLRQLVGVLYCSIFYQDITLDLRVKEIIIIKMIMIIIIIIIIIEPDTKRLKAQDYLMKCVEVLQLIKCGAF